MPNKKEPGLMRPRPLENFDDDEPKLQRRKATGDDETAVTFSATGDVLCMNHATT